MFKRKTAQITKNQVNSAAPVMLECLEDRRLLSGAHGFGAFPSFAGVGRHGGNAGGAITFDQAPSAVQDGLTALAATDNLTAPTASERVILGNSNGVETYTVGLSSAGTQSRLTVDQNGDPVTAPTVTTTTFGDVNIAAVTDAFTAIASGLGLTTPASTDVVTVSTPTSGAATYSINLGGSDTSATPVASNARLGRRITVDANGNPVGQERVTLGALSQTIQNALNSNAPSGATALTATSLIDVRTLQGVTFYTATFSGTGTTSKVSVTADGTLQSLPTSTDVDFSTLPQAAKTELQTLATADGYTGTIADTQSVTAYAEANGSTIYSVTLSVTDSTTGNTTTVTSDITVSVDQLGNPTVLPRNIGNRFGGICGFGFGGRGSDDNGNNGDNGDNSGGTTSNSGGSTTTPSTTPAVSTPTVQTPKERKLAAKEAKKAAKAAKAASKLAAKAAARALRASNVNA